MRRNVKTPIWRPLGWIFLSLGTCATCWGCFFPPALHNFTLWYYADRYVAAELEVVKFHPKQRRGGTALRGVIHPGGEEVVSSIKGFDLSQFVDPKDDTGRWTPLPAEIEGRRIEVLYWPKHTEDIQIWHPDTILRPGATDNLVVPMVRDFLISVSLLGVAIFAVRRCYRYAAAAAPPEAPERATPTWVAVAMVVVYLGVLAAVVYLMS